MYSIASSPSICAPTSSFAGAASPSNSIRLLSEEEVHSVSGAFSYSELYGSVFAGALAGGAGGLVVGGFAGVGAGALVGAVGGGIGYLSYEAWMYCFG